MDGAFLERMEFLIEIDKLKTVLRKTKIMHGDRLENDAEHTWHLAMMAIVLHPYANAGIDLLRTLKMLLIHDIVEIDAGDTFAYDTNGHSDKFERESRAAERLFGKLPQEQRNEFMELWLEFERKASNEAKFAAALDRLQPLIHNYRNQGDTWKKYNITAERVTDRNREIADGSEKLWEYAQRIIQDAVDRGLLTKDGKR